MTIKTDVLWTYQKSKLKSRFSQLTESDLSFDESMKNEMIRHLGKRLNVSTREIKTILQTL